MTFVLIIVRVKLFPCQILFRLYFSHLRKDINFGNQISISIYIDCILEMYGQNLYLISFIALFFPLKA